MPCDSGGYQQGDDYQARADIRAMKTELDRVTAILCSVLTHMYANGYGFPKEAVEWFREHKKWDESQGR